jgi:DNA repair exonuclease SbcCD ATPase subunit
MLLKRLTLRNIGVHQKLDITFKPGLVGIFGANGAGKSTITNSAYACLTNDFSRFPGTRDQIINDQSQPGDLAEIACDLDIDGVEYSLKRELGRSKCRMEFTRPGQPRQRIDKDGEFQQALFSALGFPRDVLDNFVFIDQWETFAFLKATPAKRMMAFHGLCNTGKAERIWDAVGQRIAADASLVADVQDNLAEFRKQKDDTAAEYVRQHTALASMLQVGPVVLADLQQKVNDLTALANLRENLREAEEALASAAASSLAAATKLLPVKKERDRLQSAVDAIDTSTAEKCVPILQEYILQQRQVAEDKQQIDELAEFLADMAQEPELELPE